MRKLLLKFWEGIPGDRWAAWRELMGDWPKLTHSVFQFSPTHKQQTCKPACSTSHADPLDFSMCDFMYSTSHPEGRLSSVHNYFP